MLKRICGIIIITLFIVSLGYARVGLVTLPEREQVLIKLNRSKDALIQEQRIVTVKQGINRLEFSWMNMNVRMNTVMIEPMPETADVTVLSMAIPPGSNNSIVWEVDSNESTELPVRISYLTNGIFWECSYVATVAQDEKSMLMEAEVRIDNRTVEDYHSTQFQLDVGKTVEQDLQSYESKKTELFTKENVSIEKTYTSEHQDNKNVQVYYVFNNDEEHGLGKEMLLKGKVRLYQTNSNNKVTFLGEDRIDYIPRGEEVKLYLGDTRDIELERKYILREQENIRRDKFGQIQAYDTKEHYQVKVKNHKSEKVKVNVFVNVRDSWQLDSKTNPTPEEKNANKVKFVIIVPSEAEEIIDFHVRGQNLTEGFVIQ